MPDGLGDAAQVPPRSGQPGFLMLTCRSLATFDPLGILARCVANPRHSWAMAVVRALQSGRQTALGANADFCK